MIVSPICEMLGIKYPIFQGGMAGLLTASWRQRFPMAAALGLSLQ